MNPARRAGLAVLGIVVLLVVTTGCAHKRVYGEDVSRIEATAGEEIIIALPANPTTGYNWMPGGRTDPAVATLIGSDYEAPPSNVVGASGHQRVTFRAMGRGTTTIRLDYRRPWEDTPPERSATFTITVR